MESPWNSVVNTTSSSTIVNNVKIAEYAHITSFVALTGRAVGKLYIDDIICAIDLTEYKSRASDAISTYSSISSSVMNSTVYSTLNSAYSTLTTNYDTDDEIEANIPGYISAIEALESANEDAQTSVNNFIILNDLITRANTFATTVTSYEAPEGASTVYTSNANVDPVALAAAVRAEVIEEGVKNDDTEITAVIANSSFELGSTLGWTTVDSDDTGARDNNSPYTTSSIDGSYQFNTWSQGTPIKQNVGILSAGQYKLACLVASDGGTIYLTMNDNHNEGTLTSDDGSYVNAEYTFTLASDTEVTIGAVGGDGDGKYTADGHWWYKADKFTLTYVGQDPVAQAKASLEAEIETANTLKDSWTPKVGTAPFKYDATYYNALGTQITSANTVLNSGSETASDYTTAESALETAESNMDLSTQNTPDPDKYYQIFVANNDGTASDYNLYMLKETTKTQVTVSTTPYPVKFVATSKENRFKIETPQGYCLCTDKTATSTAYTNGWEGSEPRRQEIKMILNDNGTVILSGYVGSTYDDVKYTTSAIEGGNVSVTSGTPCNWVISDAVEVTDVNLVVNATTGWGTFIAPYDNLTPSTVKAYTVSHKEGNIVYFEENETGVLSANTPYILSTEEASNVAVAFKGIANNDEETYSANGLVGLLTASTVPANSYILQYQADKDGTAFYKLAESMTGTANRCYLDLSEVPTEHNARATVRMNIFGGITGVANVEASAEAKAQEGKFIENGKLVIIKNGQKFNAAGQQVK